MVSTIEALILCLIWGIGGGVIGWRLHCINQIRREIKVLEEIRDFLESELNNDDEQRR